LVVLLYRVTLWQKYKINVKLVHFQSIWALTKLKQVQNTKN